MASPAPVLTRTSTRRILRRGGTGLASAMLLAGVLTGCADEYDSTTCGEFLDMSESEQTDFTKEAVEAQASDEEIEQFEQLGDQAYELAAGFVATNCEGQDPDAKLGDIAEDFS